MWSFFDVLFPFVYAIDSSSGLSSDDLSKHNENRITIADFE